MKYEFIEVPEIKVAFIHYKGKYDEIWHYFNILIRKLKKDADNFLTALYYDESYIDGLVEVDVCIAIKNNFDLDGISMKVLPKEKCLTYTHIGPYNKLDEVYKEINQFMMDNNIRYKLPMREVYIKGPSKFLKRSSSRYVTQILIPIIED